MTLDERIKASRKRLRTIRERLDPEDVRWDYGWDEIEHEPEYQSELVTLHALLVRAGFDEQAAHVAERID